MNFSFKYNDKQYTVADFIREKEEYILNLEHGIRVTAKQKLYSDFNAQEWVLWFENHGTEYSFIFSDINDCDFVLELKNPLCKKAGYIPKNGFPSVTSMSGPVAPNYYKESDEVSATEFRLLTECIFEDGKRSYHNNDTRSSDETMPIFDISSADTGVIVGIGWTGGRQADFVRDGENVRIITGLKNARFYLKAGEKLRSSSTVIMEYAGENKYNKFRRFVKKYFSHKTNFPHKADGLLAVSLWGALPSQNMIERINEYKNHGIKFEQVWIDAMWTVHMMTLPGQYGNIIIPKIKPA